ncbi:MAG TPA: hypothetical protein VN376_06260 [Longilinea sp.]|nr:hypothetical protein [Longilinea sp.]
MKEFRTSRIFAKDGKAVIMACDHAGFMGPVQGLGDPGALLDKAADAGVDAILTTMGIARRYSDKFGNMGLMLRVDGGSSMRSPVMGDLHRIFSVEDALRLGADAVVCMGMIGFPEEPSSLKNVVELVSQAAPWEMPVMAEMLVKGKDGAPVTIEDIGFAMRIGVELGADIIKTSYASPAEEYAGALKTCYRPVVVLGGEKAKSERDLLTSVADALKAGAKGVAIGRNVWQHKDPGGVAKALVRLVHEGISVDEALKEIKI